MSRRLRNNPTLIGEAMTHPYYPSGDEIGLDQQSGHEGHSIPPSAGPDGQPEMVEKGTSSVSPALEIDGRSRSSTRRRIQVAVSSVKFWWASNRKRKTHPDTRSAIDVAKERSNAAEISVMDRDVRTAGPLAM